MLYVGAGVLTSDTPLIHLEKGEFYPLGCLTKKSRRISLVMK